MLNKNRALTEAYFSVRAIQNQALHDAEVAIHARDECEYFRAKQTYEDAVSARAELSRVLCRSSSGRLIGRVEKSDRGQNRISGLLLRNKTSMFEFPEWPLERFFPDGFFRVPAATVFSDGSHVKDCDVPF